MEQDQIDDLRQNNDVLQGVNRMMRLYLDAKVDGLDGPRTTVTTYPGNRDAAMGYALKAKELLQEADPSLDVEREYIEQLPDADEGSHVIALHIEGGDESVEPRELYDDL